MKPLGFVIMNVRIPCMRGYNEDQIAIVLDDPSMKECPVILRTPTLYRAVPGYQRKQNYPTSCSMGYVKLLPSYSRLTGPSGTGGEDRSW